MDPRLSEKNYCITSNAQLKYLYSILVLLVHCNFSSFLKVELLILRIYMHFYFSFFFHFTFLRGAKILNLSMLAATLLFPHTLADTGYYQHFLIFATLIMEKGDAVMISICIS